MNVGTKSILFGFHQFLIHPWFVAAGWWKLYGFPTDLRLWVAFFVHDLGYWGKPNMDGPEGEDHVILGAKLMGRWFDKEDNFWHDFCLFHSRFYAKRHNRAPSKLCYADKMSIILYPRWLAKTLMFFSQEHHEYIDRIKTKYKDENRQATDFNGWWDEMTNFLRGWIKNELSNH